MLGIQGINQLIINVSVQNGVARLRGMDNDWEEKLEVVVDPRKTREAGMPVYWRTYT